MHECHSELRRDNCPFLVGKELTPKVFATESVANWELNIGIFLFAA